MLQRIYRLPILVALIFPVGAVANDAPVRLEPGGMAPFSLSAKTVLMKSEKVTVTLRRDDYVVDAEFVFYNAGPATSLTVGFPRSAYGNKGMFSDVERFLSFEAWVNGKPSQFSDTEAKKTEGDYSFVRIDRWLVRSVDFPTNQTTRTRVRYRAPWINEGECLRATYVYGTGAYWAQNIGQSTFILDASAMTGDDVELPEVYRGKQKIKPTTVRPSVYQYLVKDFEPTPTASFSAMICPPTE